jgi:molybdopterin-guanine dinucleotide biosynthesis protein A
VSGIVLAGGRSSRFGRDKLAVQYHGRPLLHHAVFRLAEVCDEIVVVIAPDVAEPSMPMSARVRAVRDDVEGEGPLAGAAAGLSALDAESALLVAGDMPELSVDVLREMIRIARGVTVAAVALSDGGRLRPVPSLVRAEPARRAAVELLASGERRLRALIAALDPHVVDEPIWTAIDPERRTLLDVDEPADLDR